MYMSIGEKIKELKYIFNQCIFDKNYNGKYYYANANKASYYAENVVTAGVYSDYYEVSSVTDLMIVRRIFKTGIVNSKKIICNGIKNKAYLSLICQMVNDGFEILDIIDSMYEFNFLLNSALKNNLDFGVRVKLESLYGHNEKQAKYDRFGLNESEIKEVADKFNKNNKLKFTTIHYHQRGSNFNQIKFSIQLEKAFQIYANYSKKISSIVNFDIGGGCPYDKINEYNYWEFADNLIGSLKGLCTKNKCKEPNIIQENGRYTVSDACFNI